MRPPLLSVASVQSVVHASLSLAARLDPDALTSSVRPRTIDEQFKLVHAYDVHVEWLRRTRGLLRPRLPQFAAVGHEPKRQCGDGVAPGRIVDRGGAAKATIA